ncbi:MAG TPA: acetyl-CoA C-acetyltransferase [Caldithrix abyssi]|uniref:Acetyl-CoA C-acetyltransferase n=1 Tax=Caldithrix abyssi TaxID=187145 RepID=A0A7V1LKI7_CALAY|nr:acetyl-CoA C-acetyltransferase [Caldithrix abyssi]
MSEIRNVVIVSAARTAVGSFLGQFKDVPATRLGSAVIKAVVQKSGIDPLLVDEVIMGNVLPANEGQAPARQAALGAGLDKAVQCLTVNKVCGSGLKAVMLAAQAIMVGDAEVIIAGGMENMSQAPFYLPGYRQGHKMGDVELVDGMIKDGLWDPYNDFHMGTAADRCAESCHVSRESQDEFSILSYKRALASMEKGLFNDEITPVEIPQRKGDPLIITEDEEPRRVRFEKIPNLKPAFGKEGSVTAANASSINDGAAAVLLMSEQKAAELGLTPMATVVSQASAARLPQEFPQAPADSIRKALGKVNLSIEDIDLFEINEAFAVVTLVNNQLLGIPVEKVNVNGGSVAIGHPIGASGARILVTLIHAMRQRDAKYGLASICIGGGEASTLIVERQ